MNKKYFLILGIIVLFTTVSKVNYTQGAIPPPSAKFNFSIDKDFVKEGDWRLNFVTVPNYGLTDLDEAKNYFSNLRKEYIEIKKMCGLSSDYEYTVLENYGELRATKNECELYSKYVGDPRNEHTITFHNFHYGYLVKNKPGEVDAIYNYPVECKVSNGHCEIVIDQEYDSRNPHFVILEKLNSNEDIYFSDPINISWDYLQKVEWKVWWGEPKDQYPLQLTEFEINKPNQLIIQFGGAEKKLNGGGDNKKEERISPLYYPIIVMIVLVIITFIWFLIRKRKKF